MTPRAHGGLLERLPRSVTWLAALGLGLAACSPGQFGPQPHLGWIEAGSPKQLEVDRAEYRHAVRFATDDDQVTALERDQLLSFLAQARLGDRDTIRLEGHADERASDLYNYDLAARRAENVAALLTEVGYGDLGLSRSVFGEGVPRASGDRPRDLQRNRRVEVVIDRYLVTLPRCPDWSRESGTDFANLPHSNFGCATQTNLGLMIAEPRDLLRGRTLAPADGVHQAESIVRYRTNKIVELEAQSVEE